VAEPDFDILVLGAGLVGTSLACALEGRGLRVGLVEASAPNLPPPGFDARKLALAAASMQALGALGVIAHAAPAPSPIRRIHVSRAGDFGTVRLRCEDSGREDFGAVVAADALGVALEQRLHALRDTTLLRPWSFAGLVQEGNRILVDLAQGEQRRRVATRLLVAADGTRSAARAALGIGTQERDYGQTLLVCSLVMDRPADGTAYERFTDDGPIALLPMGAHYGAICAVPTADAARWQALDDVAFGQAFQQRFGWRAGRVANVGTRSAYPIRRVLAAALHAPRAVLVGNAAQTIHPVGAQGFNLGLRDALALAERVDGGDPGRDALLADYVEARREDRARTLAFSDGLAGLTATPGLAARLLRSAGLLALAYVPGLSAPLASGAMGFRGRVPRLAREP
jgi:2-octaprenyl-6-methoxyphenol hydroxylase